MPHMTYDHKNNERKNKLLLENEDDLQQGNQLESDSAKASHQLLSNPQSLSNADIITLQRTIGNQAVQRLLNPVKDEDKNEKEDVHTTAEPAPRYHIESTTHAAQRVPVTGQQLELGATPTDANVGWNYQYDVSFTPSKCILAIKTKINPTVHADGRVAPTAEEVETVKENTNKSFKQMWDNKFVLVETATKKKYSLRTKLDFVDSGQDLSVSLYSGDGRANLEEWYVDGDTLTLAHELGHQMGLLDEYIDPTVANRATGTSAGVQTDHSIMGNYYTEGEDQAEVKLRHGQHIATDISTATGRTFSAIKPNGLVMFLRKILGLFDGMR